MAAMAIDEVAGDGTLAAAAKAAEAEAVKSRDAVCEGDCRIKLNTMRGLLDEGNRVNQQQSAIVLNLNEKVIQMQTVMDGQDSHVDAISEQLNASQGRERSLEQQLAAVRAELADCKGVISTIVDVAQRRAGHGGQPGSSSGGGGGGSGGGGGGGSHGGGQGGNQPKRPRAEPGSGQVKSPVPGLKPVYRTAAQKAFCMDKGRCMFCYGDKHVVKNCKSTVEAPLGNPPGFGQ
jgi:uncharacterized coiled-coil protein SlyX